MGFKLVIITILFTIAAKAQISVSTEIPYQDEKFACVTDADAKRYVQDFGVDSSSFGGFELCNSKVEFKKLMNDFNIIEKGKFAVGQNLFIKNFLNGADYYTWMKSQTRSVHRGNDVPYATAYNSGGNFTMQDGWAKLSTLGRVGTVIHEARHTAGYRHVPCTQGTYQGSNLPGCDTNYTYGGSHAIEMEYYARVTVQGTNFHPVYKKMARLMAIGRSNIFFNTPIIQKKESLMALSQDRKKAFVLTENNLWVSKEVPAVTGNLKRTSFGAVLFDLKQAFAIDPYQNSGFADAVSDVYSYFKLLGEGNSNLKDLEEYDIGVKRFVTKVTDSNEIASYDFPNGDWGQSLKLPFAVTATSTAVPGVATSGYYLIQSTGDIGQFQPTTNRVSMLNTKWDFNNKKTILLNSDILVLKQNGEIKKWISATVDQPWAPASTLGTVSDMVAFPLYDGFKVVVE